MKKKHDERQYQVDMEDAVLEYIFTKAGNPLVACPGGAGKSFVMAKLIKKFVTKWPGTNILVLAQDSKLLSQNCNELLRYWPDAPCGIYSAGLKQRDTRDPIIFGGIQSVAKRGEELGKRHIIFIDEADLVSPKDDALYNKLIKTLKIAAPNLRVVGFTASPFRLGTGCLTNLPLWDAVCIDLTRAEKFLWFIKHGYLCPLINKKGAVEVDITNIAMKGGEFDEKELQAATDTYELNKAVVEETIRYGEDRKHWLIFSTGIEHGHNLAKMFRSRGVTAEMLSGKDTMERRAAVEADWRAGKIRAVVNVGLYGRGFDFPAIDLIVWARATQSPALWLQGCVRGTRIFPGKNNALILDMAGNTRRLGPVNNVIVPTPRRKGDAVKGEAPVKVCPQCFSYRPTQERICADCGYKFPPPKTITKKAATDDILAGIKKEPQIEEFHIRSIRYKAKVAKSGTEYLEITYGVLTERFREALFFGNDNLWSVRRLESWWKYRGGELPAPTNSKEALDRAHSELKIPTLIRVDISQKWPKVVGCEFEEDPKISDGETTISIDKPYCESQPDDDIDVPF